MTGKEQMKFGIGWGVQPSNVQILLLFIFALNRTKFLEALSWKHNMPQIQLGVEVVAMINVIVTQIVWNQGVLTSSGNLCPWPVEK